MKYTGNFFRDHKALMPVLIVDRVTADPKEARLLILKTYRLYKLNKSWGKKITDTNKGRDLLYAFLQHWHQAFVLMGRI